MSPEDMVTCDFGNFFCKRGLVTESINYLITEGLVTDTCKPYMSGSGVTNYCQYSCKDLAVAYEKYACKPSSANFLSTIEEIMTEVYINGPV